MSADEPTDDAAGEPADVGDDAADAADAGRPDGARVHRSYGPVIALGLAAAVAIAAVVVAIVGGDDVSATAVRVNSSEVSQKTFNAQLRELAPVLLDEGAPASSVTSAFVPSRTSAQLAQLYVYRDVLGGHVDASAADRRQALDQLGASADGVSPRFRRLVVDVTALQTELLNRRGAAGAQRVFARLARRADIQVDPRYGFWNPARAQVCPPTGCTAAATGG